MSVECTYPLELDSFPCREFESESESEEQVIVCDERECVKVRGELGGNGGDGVVASQGLIAS